MLDSWDSDLQGKKGLSLRRCADHPQGRRRAPRKNGPGWPGVLALAVLAWLSVMHPGRALAQVGEGECNPQEAVCVDVFEDDPEAITARWDGNQRVWVVEPPTGYVRIRHKGDVVTARRMRLHEETEYAYLEEDVQVLRQDARITSRILELWWQREDFVFTGDVVVVQLEAETPAEGEGAEGERQEGTGGGGEAPARDDASGVREVRTVWAQRVEYDGETGDVVAQEDVHMVDDQYLVWAQEMIYRKEPQEMYFNRQVRVVSAERDWAMWGERFFYDLDAKEGHLFGPHRIEVIPRESGEGQAEE